MAIKSKSPVPRRSKSASNLQARNSKSKPIQSAISDPSKIVERNFEIIRRKRRKILTRLAMVALFLSVCVGIVYLIFFSPVFALKSDKVELLGSSKYIKVEQVEEVIADYVDTPITRLNLAHIQNRLGNITGISEVEIAHNFPDGLKITITPSVPIAYEKVGESFRLFDDQAAILGVQTQTPDKLMLIKLDKNSSVPLRGMAINLLKNIPDELKSIAESIEVKSNVELILNLPEGYQIFFGDDTDLNAKILVAQRIYEQLGKETKKIIDVSSSTSPVLR
jgi:cell division protein FtsQ